MTPFYFGNINYWKTIVHFSTIGFNVDIKIPKKSYINRTIIATANGLQTLSIPLQGGRGSFHLYKDIKISYAENWQTKHIMALKSAYSKSPFFEYYGESFVEILSSKKEHLIDLNLSIYTQILKVLKLDQNYTFVNSEDKKILTDNIPNEFKIIESYPQVFRNKFEFQTDLSILDLIFNLGPKSKEYLLQK